MTDRQPLEEILKGVFEDSRLKLDEKVERKNKLSFVLSDQELELLNTTRGGIKISEYLRSVLFNKRQPISRATVPAINREVLAQLNRIGGLLNQQTRVLNTAKMLNSFSAITPEFLQQYLDTLEELNQFLKEIGWEITRLNAGIEDGNQRENF